MQKPTEQSTTHGSQSASKAVDGNKDKVWLACTHTAVNKQNPWWRVDLEQRIAVTHVKIVNRNVFGDRLNGFEIRVGDSLKNNGITSPRCGSPQRIPPNQVKTHVHDHFSQNQDPKKKRISFLLFEMLHYFIYIVISANSTRFVLFITTVNKGIKSCVCKVNSTLRAEPYFPLFSTAAEARK